MMLINRLVITIDFNPNCVTPYGDLLLNQAKLSELLLRHTILDLNKDIKQVRGYGFAG